MVTERALDPQAEPAVYSGMSSLTEVIETK